MLSKKLGCDVARRCMSTATSWAEAADALKYTSKTKQNMLDRSRVSEETSANDGSAGSV